MVVSLLEFCVRSAIDNLQYLSDVGETDIQLLKRILPHCNADQLNHIETSTKVCFRFTLFSILSSSEWCSEHARAHVLPMI